MFAAGCFVIDYRRHACEFRQTLPFHVQPLEERRLGGVAGFEQGCSVAWFDLGSPPMCEVAFFCLGSILSFIQTDGTLQSQGNRTYIVEIQALKSCCRECTCPSW